MESSAIYAWKKERLWQIKVALKLGHLISYSFAWKLKHLRFTVMFVYFFVFLFLCIKTKNNSEQQAPRLNIKQN